MHRAIWEKIYGKKAPDAVCWYRPYLEPSLEVIERAAPLCSESIIDMGGGEPKLSNEINKLEGANGKSKPLKLYENNQPHILLDA